MDESQQDDKQALSILRYQPVLKGKSLDFQKYANQTQNLLFRQTSSLLKNRNNQSVGN